MDAMTLYQPWASGLALGDKINETRDWCPPRRLIGSRLAIHAGRRRLRVNERTAPELHRAITESNLAREYGPDWHGKLPRGAVVATALVTGLFYVARRRGDQLALEGYGESPGDVRPDPWGDFRPGRWIWTLRDVVRLDPPVPAIGGRKIWRWEPPWEKRELAERKPAEMEPVESEP